MGREVHRAAASSKQSLEGRRALARLNGGVVAQSFPVCQEWFIGVLNGEPLGPLG